MLLTQRRPPLLALAATCSARALPDHPAVGFCFTISSSSSQGAPHKNLSTRAPNTPDKLQNTCGTSTRTNIPMQYTSDFSGMKWAHVRSTIYGAPSHSSALNFSACPTPLHTIWPHARYFLHTEVHYSKTRSIGNLPLGNSTYSSSTTQS